MKAVVAAFNQEKALEGAFSVITNHRMDLFEALLGGGPAAARVPAGLPPARPHLAPLQGGAAARQTRAARLRGEDTTHSQTFKIFYLLQVSAVPVPAVSWRYSQDDGTKEMVESGDTRYITIQVLR